MQSNPAPTTVGRIAWDGAAAKTIDISNYNQFGFVFEPTAAIATDAVFNVMFHDGTAADPCVPDVAQSVPEIATCAGDAVPGPQATITIPAGTAVGQLCYGTIPCRPGRFISLAAVSGDTANVEVVMVLQGPKF